MPNLRMPFDRAVPRRSVLGPASSMVICLLSSVSKKGCQYGFFDLDKGSNGGRNFYLRKIRVRAKFHRHR